jgi:hypothetical protein
VVAVERGEAAVGRPAAGNFLVHAGDPVVAGRAYANQGLAAREIVAAADQRLHAGAADHRLHARPDGPLCDQQVGFDANHAVAVRHVDGAAADHAAGVPLAVEHDDDAGVARLPMIGVRNPGRDRKRGTDTHADEQRGPWNAVHEALTHDDLPAGPLPSVHGLARDAC